MDKHTVTVKASLEEYPNVTPGSFKFQFVIGGNISSDSNPK
jgi:hypothetical protein